MLNDGSLIWGLARNDMRDVTLEKPWQWTKEERVQTEKRHAEFYLQIAQAADEFYLQGGEKVLKGLELFDAELTNIRAGQAWAAGKVETDDDAARLCSDYPNAAVYVMDLRVSAREQIRWQEQASAAACRLGDKQGEGVHLNNLGVAYVGLGDMRKAIGYYEQALAIAREIDDKHHVGATLGNLGCAYYRLGEVAKAIEYH